MLDFYKTDGTTIEVATMKKEEKLDYTSNSLFDAVKIPYGNGQYNMVLFLPTEGKNSQNIIDNLSASNWKKWMESFSTEDHVVITLPRFKFAFEMPLKNILKEMGMLKAFDSQAADFSNITDEDLFISRVLHKSFIDLNETGTEAAAVTAIIFRTTSTGNEPPKKYFNVNKPFVFAITEKDTGAILFMGEVNHPDYE
jgi:serpin B